MEVNQVSVEIVEGVGKKSGKPYKAVKVVIGEYEKLIFPTNFEMKYIETIIK